MKNTIKKFALLPILISFSCVNSNDSNLIATYNDGKIYRKDLQERVDKIKSGNKKLARLTVESLTNPQKESIVKDIVIAKKAAKKAKKMNLDDESFAKSVENFSNNLLQTKLYVKLVEDATRDEIIKKKYDELKLQLVDKKDFKIAIIILENQEKASNIRNRLKKNYKLFNYFATKKSIDKNLAKNKGVIDFTNETAMAPVIVSEIKKLKKYQTSQPIDLGNKWAIIKLLGQRDAKIISFEDSKAQLSKSLAISAIKEFTDSAVKDSNLQMLLK